MDILVLCWQLLWADATEATRERVRELLRMEVEPVELEPVEEWPWGGVHF
jgi:hypothetical protein